MKSTVKQFKHNGQKMTLKEWAEYLGISYHTLYDRYRKGYKLGKLLHKGSLPNGRPYKVKKEIQN